MRFPTLRSAGLLVGVAALACTTPAQATHATTVPPRRDAAAAAPDAAVDAAIDAPKPTLVVFITVDQLRTDYLTTRFAHQLTGGLKRLLEGGAFYVNGMHDHAITETAPGHAATMSGRFPVRTGIMMNSQGVNTPEAPLLDARGPGASPFRFQGTTLTDWLVARDKRTRVLSVSRKDRGAILPIGRSKQPVFWFADGKFTTSTYYAATLPDWVQAFNARELPESYAGKTWDLLLPATEYPEVDDVPQENGGRTTTMPKTVPADIEAAARSLPGFPFMDDVTAHFALQGLETLKLGKGPQTDVLAVSFSTLDAVGHAYGPDSREVHDMVLRLDRTLGMFLDSLFTLREPGRVVVALTGDHGVAPYIGVKSADPNQDARYVDLRPAAQGLLARLAAAGVDTNAVVVDDGVVAASPAILENHGRVIDREVGTFLDEVRRIPGVLRGDRLKDLARADTVRDDVARRWLHMFDPRSSTVIAVVTPTPYSVWQGTTYATHGTPHDYDAKVPVLFFGAGIKPGRHEERARVVDMAPTLARLLGVRPLEKLDGVPLTSALQHP